jgi:hypothetical protein
MKIHHFGPVHKAKRLHLQMVALSLLVHRVLVELMDVLRQGLQQ